MTELMCVQVRYLGLVEKLKALMVDPVYDLNAAVYTELSDVEAEINGLITYDRQVCVLNSSNQNILHMQKTFIPPQGGSLMTSPWLQV